MQKKPKKDEIVTLVGDVGDIFPNLITVENKNLSITTGSKASNDIKILNLNKGESARVTYQNGILLTIERNQSVPQIVGQTPAKSQEPDNNMHIDKDMCPDKTADLTAEKSSKKELTTEIPAVNHEVCPDTVDLEKAHPVKSDMHMQLTTETLEKLLAGKTYEEIFNIKELFDRLAKEANVKDTIDAFDKDRLINGAIVADAEMTGIGGVWGNKYENTIYEFGTRCDYKITIILPETEEELNARKVKEKYERDNIPIA